MQHRSLTTLTQVQTLQNATYRTRRNYTRRCIYVCMYEDMHMDIDRWIVMLRLGCVPTHSVVVGNRRGGSAASWA